MSNNAFTCRPLARRRTIGAAAAALAALLISACSPVDLLNRAAGEDNFRIDSGLAYGDHPRQKLDVYVPSARAETAGKVVVFFYGGRWQSGSRESYLFVAEALADAGIITVIPDYKLYPEVRYPEFVEDGAKAVQWVLHNIARFGGDPDSIYLAGHSSGAYIAAMLALDERFLGAGIVKGTVGLAGPYDFLPLGSGDLRRIFGAADDLSETQPINHVDGDEAPFLLITGESDRVVDPGNSLRLAARIRKHGGRVRTALYPHTGHRLVVGSLARPLRGLAPTLRDMLSFLDASG